MVTPVHIRNAHVWDNSQFVERNLYTTTRISDDMPENAVTVDLTGYKVFPALVNPHDHLELNHYPRTKYRELYDNAHQWGEDVTAGLDDAPIKDLRRFPLEQQVFIGGLKNMLCGALTVIHHNPLYKQILKRDFPVRVLRNYAWVHSLHFAPQAEVLETYRMTPKGASWFIHLAEGVDETAAAEYTRLKALDCVSERTIFVHALGMTFADWNDAQTHYPNGARFVWSPTSDKFLFGATVGYTALSRQYPMLGNESRLTAQGDLLDEICFAYDYLPAKWKADAPSPEAVLMRYLANRADFITKWTQTGTLAPQKYADYIVYQADRSLSALQRADLALIVRGGEPQIGDPEVMAKFPHVKTVPATLDGKPKLINSRLARKISSYTLQEQGLSISSAK